MIIITGASGFIGSALLWELNQRGVDNVVISDHYSPEERPGLLDQRQYEKFVPAKDLKTFLQHLSQPPSYIFHLGACSSTTEKNTLYLRQNNTDYTAQLFNYCADLNIPIQYASSGAVYGNGHNGFSDEASPSEFTPLNPYGQSKLDFDIHAVNASHAPPRWYGLRFFNVYGPNEYHKGDMASVAFKAFNQIKDSGELKLFRSHHPDYPDGGQLRDFIYVKDITGWMVELMDKTSFVPSGIYNMGFGKARTWMDLATAVFHALQKPVKIHWIPIPEDIRSQYQYFTEARIDRLMAADISPPKWSLEAGVEDYITQYLLRPNPYL